MTQNVYKSLTERQIENLTEPGYYHLPFLKDDCDVKVVYATPAEARMKCIIVEVAPNLYLDYYYNDCNEAFKPLTVPECKLEEWMDDETATEEEYHRQNTFGYLWDWNNVGVPCPAEFANFEVVMGAYNDVKNIDILDSYGILRADM